ncbi:MAG: glycosyltransferase family 2 protein [Bacteroidia bacterium]|nr:glycosyltransferase family 2 protein [Bacteroidia bacterium]
MDISVIIVNYNTGDLVIHAIHSLYEQTKDVSFEVIVVDNASGDDSCQIIQKKFPDVHLIRNQENMGFGRANNIGSEKAKGEYLFLLNSDTILINDALSELFMFMESHPKAGICGGNLWDENRGPALSYSMRFPSVWLEMNDLFFTLLTKIMYGENAWFNHTNHDRIVAYVSGADLMIRRDLFVSMNGFDVDFFMYYEETELTWRIHQRGFDVYNVPSANIIHLEGKSFSSDIKKTRMKMRSRSLFYEKTSNKNTKQRADKVLYISAKIHYVVAKMIRNKEKQTYWSTILECIY